MKYVYLILLISIFPTLTYCRKHPVNGRYTRNIEEYEFSVPHKLTFNGDFVSFKIPHYFEPTLVSPRKKRSSRDPDAIHLGIHADNKLHHAVLWPNYALVSPDLIIESRDPRNVEETTFHELADKKICYYLGKLEDTEDSKVALSTCDGLVGTITIGNQKFFIEPLEDHEPNEEGQHLHIVYKRDTPDEFDDFDILFAGKDVDSEKKCRSSEKNGEENHLNQDSPGKEAGREKRNVNSTFGNWYIETMIVCDKRFLEYHKDLNRERFILTVFNMAADYIHDASIGQQIELVLVRLLYLDKQERELDLDVTHDAKKTLESFCKWQRKFNIAEGKPGHADIALLFTRLDVCHGSDCEVVGQSFIGTPCKQDRNCAYCEDNGLEMGLLIAHQIGHLLGAPDDDLKKSGCTSDDLNDGTPYIMSSNTNLTAIRWSECSKKSISNTFGLGLGDCMLNRPPPAPYLPKPVLPGVVYDWEAQCQFVVPDSVPCPTQESLSNICEELRCLKPIKGKENEKLECFSLGKPPADGTKCEENMWCFQEKCVKSGQRPHTIDGDWSTWAEWSECTRSCGRGVSYALRECNNPLPANGGRYCDGDKIRYKICNPDTCPENATSFRQQQCEAFNGVPDEEAKTHKYKAFLNPEAPCSLWCTTEEGNNEELNSLVKDGTRCQPGRKNVCVNGECWGVGCDNMLNSAAVEDVCGTCNGDGTGCKIVEETFKDIGDKDYTTVAVLPTGVKRVLIEELAPSQNVIAITDKSEKKFYLNEKYTEQSDGVYKFGKVEGVYTHTAPNQEKLTIKGPLNEDLVFKVLFMEKENVGYHYQYAEMDPDSSEEPKFHWDIGDMGDCSARCGSGIQMARLHCSEQKAGKVSDTFCTGLEQPEQPTQHCNMQPCSTKWRTGNWSACDACKGKPGVQKRGMACVDENPNPLGEAILVEEDLCPEPAPGTTKVCSSDKPCKTKRYVHYIPHSHLGDVWIKMQPKSVKSRKQKREERAASKPNQSTTKETIDMGEIVTSSTYATLPVASLPEVHPLNNNKAMDPGSNITKISKTENASNDQTTFVVDTRPEKYHQLFIYPLKKAKDAAEKDITSNLDRDPEDNQLENLEEDKDKIKQYKGKEAVKLIKELVKSGEDEKAAQEKKNTVAIDNITSANTASIGNETRKSTIIIDNYTERTFDDNDTSKSTIIDSNTCKTSIDNKLIEESTVVNDKSKTKIDNEITENTIIDNDKSEDTVSNGNETRNSTTIDKNSTSDRTSDSDDISESPIDSKIGKTTIGNKTIEESIIANDKSKTKIDNEITEDNTIIDNGTSENTMSIGNETRNSTTIDKNSTSDRTSDSDDISESPIDSKIGKTTIGNKTIEESIIANDKSNTKIDNEITEDNTIIDNGTSENTMSIGNETRNSTTIDKNSTSERTSDSDDISESPIDSKIDKTTISNDNGKATIDNDMNENSIGNYASTSTIGNGWSESITNNNTSERIVENDIHANTVDHRISGITSDNDINDRLTGNEKSESTSGNGTNSTTESTTFEE